MSCEGCSGTATFFCLCRNTKPVFCQRCLPVHVMSGGAHLTSPLAAAGFIVELADIRRYNVRLQAVDSMCKTLDDLERKVKAEQVTAVQQLRCIEDEHVQALKQAFERVRMEVDCNLKALLTALGHVREELEACENEAEYQFSPTTHLFLSAAQHLSDRPFVCLSLPMEVARRILLSFSAGDLDSSRAWERLMRERRCRTFECPRCQALRCSLEVPEAYIPDRTDDSSFFSTFISQRDDTASEELSL